MTDNPHRDLAIKQISELKAQDQVLADLRERLHYANGTCDLAMKHRDVAEAAVEKLRATLTLIERATWHEGDGSVEAYQRQLMAVRKLASGALTAESFDL